MQTANRTARAVKEEITSLLETMTRCKERARRGQIVSMIDEHAKKYLEENWKKAAEDAWWNSPDDLDKAYEEAHAQDKKDGLHG
jgi:hypothetical protein